MPYRKFVQPNARKFSQTVKVAPRFTFACCDCGLVHDIALGTTMKVRRNKRRTTAYRAAKSVRHRAE